MLIKYNVFSNIFLWICKFLFIGRLLYNTSLALPKQFCFKEAGLNSNYLNSCRKMTYRRANACLQCIFLCADTLVNNECCVCSVMRVTINHWTERVYAKLCKIYLKLILNFVSATIQLCQWTTVSLGQVWILPRRL